MEAAVEEDMKARRSEYLRVEFCQHDDLISGSGRGGQGQGQRKNAEGGSSLGQRKQQKPHPLSKRGFLQICAALRAGVDRGRAMLALRTGGRTLRKPSVQEDRLSDQEVRVACPPIRR